MIIKKKFGFFLFFLVGIFFDTVAFSGTNFDIVPASGYLFPTHVVVGGKVSAYYSITNKTQTPRLGYSISGLPQGVIQDTSPSYCQSLINLQPNRSCLLKLDITRAVASNFALCRNSTCSSASRALNISLLRSEPVIAAGSYRVSAVSNPLIATSVNGGWHWGYSLTASSLSLPSDSNGNSVFSSASCSGLRCIASGYYTVNNLGIDHAPLIASSSNGGVTWQYTLDSNITPLPQGYDDCQDSSYTSCSGLNCVSSVDYYEGNSIFPLIASSTNGGQSWLYTMTSASPAVPTACVGQYLGNTVAHVTSVSCSGSHCIAAGECSISFNDNGPLLASSSTGGQTWTYAVTPTSPSLPNNTVASRFSGASCSGLTCIAVGSHRLNTNDTFPLVGYSHDGGVTWSYARNLDQGLPTNCLHASAFGFTSASLQSASCNGRQCIAAGVCQTTTGNLPLVVSSFDGGSSWSYTIPSSGSTLPNGATSVNLGTASCSQLTCVVAGYYTNNTSEDLPLIANSTDGGRTWHYSVTGVSPTIPQSCLNGGSSGRTTMQLTSVDCKGGSCVAVGYCRTSNGQNRIPLALTTTDGGFSWAYTISNASNPALPSGATFSMFRSTSLGK